MRRSASEIIRNLEMRIARLERQAAPFSELSHAKRFEGALRGKLERLWVPDSISVRTLEDAFGNTEVHIRWNPNNVYNESSMTEDESSWLSDDAISTNELNVALEKTKKAIREVAHASIVKQDSGKSNMRKGMIVYTIIKN